MCKLFILVTSGRSRRGNLHRHNVLKQLKLILFTQAMFKYIYTCDVNNRLHTTHVPLIRLALETPVCSRSIKVTEQVTRISRVRRAEAHRKQIRIDHIMKSWSQWARDPLAYRNCVVVVHLVEWHGDGVGRWWDTASKALQPVCLGVETSPSEGRKRCTSWSSLVALACLVQDSYQWLYDMYNHASSQMNY